MSPNAVGIVAAVGSRDKNTNSGHESNGTLHLHNPGTSMLLWMLVDGIGLAIITACTILEGFELWRDYFNEYAGFNCSSLTFWLSGRTSQVVGLMSLITHAASMQVFHELEWAGMMMLTAGPLLNMCACSIFDSGADSFFIYNKQWMTSESLERLGIVILDLSLIEGPEHLVLSAEVIGFMILACAAIIDFEYSIGHWIPSISMRVDLIHLSDCFGLGLLTVVAIGQYHIKMAKHKADHDGHILPQNAQQKSIIPRNTASRRPIYQASTDNGYANDNENNGEEEFYDEENKDTDISALLPDISNRNGQKQSFHRGNNGLQYQIQNTALSNIGLKTPAKQTVAMNTRHEQHND